jgi:branched-chain amino acid transport system ATP-binding protein
MRPPGPGEDRLTKRSVYFLVERQGLAVLLSEQNLHFARRVADRATIIEEGRIRYTGTMEDLSRNREIKKEYLSA